MSDRTFRALVLNQIEKKTHAEFQNLPISALPEGDVLINVAYSTLNYKDGLAVTGKGRIVRHFPMVPGVDFCGTVEASDSPEFQPGDKVVLTGWGVGEKHWGGYSQMARVKSDWLVPLAKGITLKQSMGIGTAGITAMMCVMALEANGVGPDSGEIVVTGASGGVGSMAVAILANLGYKVVASTGRTSLNQYLKSLGAHQIIDRNELARTSKHPLESRRWAGAVDTVGGDTLATILRTTNYYGTVTACGLVGGHHLNTTVFPFILRGIKLVGIESVMFPKAERLKVWSRLAKELPLDALNETMQMMSLSEIPNLSEEILKGKVRGRTVIDVNQ